MSPEDQFKFSKLRATLIVMAIFWVVAIVLWQTTGKILATINTKLPFLSNTVTTIIQA